MAKRVAILLAIAIGALAFIGCGGDDGGPEATPSPTAAPANPPGNLFQNGDFELGLEPWTSLDPNSHPEITTDRALTGSHSAALRMRDDVTRTGTHIYYLVQEITPSQMPDVLRGAYRVENWQRGTTKQYLQFVVIAFGPDNFPKTVDNWQLRYLLAGVKDQPLEVQNARYLQYSAEDPAQDVWVTFEAPIKKDFLEQWNVVPENFEKLRILFEVRFDDKAETDGVANADVYYDSLYIGDGG